MRAIRMLSSAVVILALVAGNAAVCSAWVATPEARMACCADSDACPMHDSVSQTAGLGHATHQDDADRCCASSERDNSAPSPGAFVVAPVLSVAVSPVPFVVPQPLTVRMAWTPPVLGLSADVRTHVLLSVFLL